MGCSDASHALIGNHTLLLSHVDQGDSLSPLIDEIQEAFKASLPIDMGQILSIPFIILGVYCMLRARK